MGKDEEESKFQTASVTFLDGTVNEFKVHRGSRGEELFTLVSNGMSVEEKDHFALCFFDNQGMRHWIYNDKKIVRQLKGLPWVFSFQVKFFPISPATLKDDTARHMMYLQCREDIKTGKLSASLPTRASLAALIAQSEFGDSSVSVDYDEYVRGCTEGDELGEKLKLLHATHKGMNEGETEMAYLNECKDLSTYGVWQFPAKDSKGVEVMVGISAHGIVILREAVRLHRFPWQSIVKISYRRHYFSIRLKAGEVEKKECTLTYDCFTYEEAKRVWKCGVEHHTFFRLIQPEFGTKGSLFHWGSSPFRFQGRTSFQNKMASQMFDEPTNVVRSPGSERHMKSLERENEVRTRSHVQLNHDNLEDIGHKDGADVMGVDGSCEKRKRKEGVKTGKDEGKKKKGRRSSSNESSDSSDDNEHEMLISKAANQMSCTSHSFTPSAVGSLVREERLSHTYRLTGDGLLPQFTPDHSSLEMETTMARCEALNSSVPHVAHCERERSVRASAPLPRHYSEVGEARCAEASWKESSEGPGEIEYQKDAHGNLIEVRSMVSHTKHSVHKHSYTTLQGMGQVNSEAMPSSEGEKTLMVDNWTRSVEYSNEGMGNDDMGELVSSKCIQSGSGREIEILTYKRMGINGMEEHLEYRVTIHSDAPIDHDAELSAAILEATAVNPNYHVEKIEVRQESTH